MDTLTLFDLTSRPDDLLIFKKKDPNDVRFGDIVQIESYAYRKANFVILGCPQDFGVMRSKEREGARQAPNEIRRAFYKLPVPETLSQGQLLDIGDTIVQGGLEQIHHRHSDIVEQILRDGKILIVLGGGGDIAYPDCKGLQKVFPNILVFNFDAQFDVRTDESLNSYTSYRRLLEEKIISPDNFFEVGSQPFSNAHFYQKYLNEKNVAVFPLESLRRYGIDKRLEEVIRHRIAPQAIFWGIDMNCVRASDAPGVSSPSPIGFASEEICQIASIAGKRNRTRVLEISEVNPMFDLDARTSKLAALMMAYFIRAKSAFET